MNRFRSILLSGLVALLMVGFVNAGDVSELPPGAAVDTGFNIYFGTWNPDKTLCLQTGGTDCINLGFSFDFQWIKDLFN
ncbi:MAG: hypothetical protein H8E26_03695 [FCB group bacterium]|nr:hypothetical protein [FCB group bacterium]MBL7029244.1 hypothetical protein [Candidatus Neomarinimicrobiota bacterium]MBL7123002.1 hypothetical protein [Candidatus Neomarinimicrobiota bacterium]